METKKQPGITSQHLEAILASEGRQEDVEEEGMEDNETVSEKSSKKSATMHVNFFSFLPHNTFVIIIRTSILYSLSILRAIFDTLSVVF